MTIISRASTKTFTTLLVLMNYQDNIANVQLWTDCSIVVGRLYDEAFVQRRNNGSSAGGFSQTSFNGKEISCTIVPRYMKNGSWSSTTRWKVDGKRVAHKQLIQTICGPL